MNNFSMKKWITMASLLLLTGATSAAAQTVGVDCDAGGTISGALATAQPGTTIAVSGTCREAVTVSVDRLTLVGGGGATLTGVDGDEDLLTVRGARDVVVSSLVLENAARGLVVLDGASVTANAVISQAHAFEGFQANGSVLHLVDSQAINNGDEGIEAESSTLTLSGVTSRRNNAGLRVLNNGSARFSGSNLFRDNQGPGIVVMTGASAFAFFSEVLSLANEADGIDLIGGSALFVGGTLRSRVNNGHGIALTGNSSLQLGFPTVPVATEVITVANGLDGIFVTGGSSLELSGFAEVETRGNNSGVHVRQGSSARLSGLDARGNRAWGVVADDASISLFASDLVNNGAGQPDLFLRFGSRATVGSSNIGALGCEVSALIRGENAQGDPIACP